jgi:hypothetical protein
MPSFSERQHSGAARRSTAFLYDNNLALLTSSSRFNLELAINSFNRTDGLVLSQALLSRFLASARFNAISESRHEINSSGSDFAGDDRHGRGRRLLRAVAARRPP